MGAIKDLLARTLDDIETVGRAHAELQRPLLTDAELWAKAHGFAPELFPGTWDEQFYKNGVDAQLDELREAYNAGRQPTQVINFTAVLKHLRRAGIDAELERIGPHRGIVLLAGPKPIWPDAYDQRQRPVALGPGIFETEPRIPIGPINGRLTVGPTGSEHPEMVQLGTTSDQVAEKIVTLVRVYEGQQKRLDEAVEKAGEAFWDAVVTQYPEVQTGDFGPDETMTFEVTTRGVMQLWLLYNTPAEGIAASGDDAAEIVAARRAVAVERITPMVDLVHDYEPEGLSDLLHETLQDDAARRTKGYDNSVHADWLVWTAIYERASVLHEKIDVAGPAEVAALLVDLLGEYQTVSALVELAKGELCDGRLPDRGLCGARLDDGEGQDGKCGTCSDRAAN